jgi:hypothetical protein
MTHKSLRLLITLFALAGVTLTSYSFAADIGIKAGDNNGNATFHEILTPGQKIDKYIELVNTATQESSGTIISKDGLQSTDGSFTFISTDEENKQAGAWYTLAESAVTIPAGNVKRVDFAVTVPSTTEPGEYGSSLAIVEKSNEQTSGNIRIVNRNGIRNLFVVKGSSVDQLRLGNKINDLQFTKSAETNRVSTVSFQMVNVGNLFSKSEITYDLRGPKDYSKLDRLATDLGPTDKTISINTNLQAGGWQDGGYTLVATLKNSAVNRRLTKDDYRNEVKEQKITFTFDVNLGEVRNLKISDNLISKDGFDASWWKPEYLWIILGLLVLLGGSTAYWYLNKKDTTKTKNPPHVSSKTPTKISL